MSSRIEVERRLIAACMAGGPGSVAAAAAAGVTPKQFTDALAARLWSAVQRAAQEERETSPWCVVQAAWGAAAGDKEFAQVAEVAGMEPTSARAVGLARAVVAEHRRDNVMGALTRALAAAKSGPWGESWEEAAAEIHAAERAAVSAAEDVPLATYIQEAIDRESGNTPPSKVSTGMTAIDEEFGRPAPGEVVVLAGRPGTGKTALALQMADSTVKRGGTVAFISLEMSGADVVARVARNRARERGVIQRGVSKAEYQNAKAERIRQAEALREAQAAWNLYDVRAVHSVAQAEGRARLLVATRGLDLLVIDYLQLLAPDDQKVSREQQIAQMSRRLKLLALSINVPILLLSQLNRAAEVNDRPPRLSDLRESGAIEQDADKVWLLYPDPKAPHPGDNPRVPICFEQAKCRNGVAGLVAQVEFFKPAFAFSKHAAANPAP